MTDMSQDFKNGVLLCHLLEIISGKTLPRFNKNPKMGMQESENCEQAITFIKSEGIKLVNIGGSDIKQGKTKLTMGLIWTLILRYEINKGDGDDSGGKNKLLAWVRSKIPEYDIKNFTSDWNDGRAINALNNAVVPGSCPNHAQLSGKNALSNATQGIETAERVLGVAPLIYPSEMVHPKVDEHAMMCYLAQFMDATPPKPHVSQNCSAHGDGLENGVAGRNARFAVSCPEDAPPPVVWVEGPVPVNPKDVKITDNGHGNYTVDYTPTVPGTYLVHVAVDGKEIPGSAFTVIVVPAHLRVFLGTGLASNTAQSLKNIETALDSGAILPIGGWKPLDCLEKKDRENMLNEQRGKVRAILLLIDEDATLSALQKAGEPDKLIELARSLGGRPPIRMPPSGGGGGGGGAGGKGKFCPECGAKAESSKFCMDCGARF